MNVSFTEKQQNYIARLVKSGDFQNASEVVRDALRLHQIYQEKLIAALRAEIARGDNSGISKCGVRDIMNDVENRLQSNDALSN